MWGGGGGWGGNRTRFHTCAGLLAYLQGLPINGHYTAICIRIRTRTSTFTRNFYRAHVPARAPQAAHEQAPAPASRESRTSTCAPAPALGGPGSPVRWASPVGQSERKCWERREYVGYSTLRTVIVHLTRKLLAQSNCSIWHLGILAHLAEALCFENQKLWKGSFRLATISSTRSSEQCPDRYKDSCWPKRWYQFGDHDRN